MSDRKKKILFQSDYSLAKTGFARNAKALLTYLYRTGKYEIVHYCCGVQYSNPGLKTTPWKSIGCLPDNPQELQMLQKDPNVGKMAGYGAHYLDRVIKEEKPDIYIAVQDIWGVEFAINKPWFNKINSIIWTTLDSLPILPSAIAVAPKVKNYWIWSEFATKVLHEQGHDHVKTLHGALEDECFYRLPDSARLKLRKSFNISEDTFVIGFVFRNQLRKSVPNLLQGYKIFKERNPGVKTKLMFHTHFGEGWNIHRLAKEEGIETSEILCTYACRQCSGYEVKEFTKQDLACPHCGRADGQVTAQVSCGVTEEQLNEVYNLMDVYCHPFTSGGQEIPIQEAKLTELITLVTNYSCGEDMCVPEARTMPLDWTEYREHGTEFIKASTSPKSIAKQLTKVYKMKPQSRRKMEREAREWTLENYSVKVLGGKLEKFLDTCEHTSYDFLFEKAKEKHPDAIIPKIENPSEWLVSLYKLILEMEVDENDEGHKYWSKELLKGTKKETIEDYFRQVARKENAEAQQATLKDFIDENGKKRILVVLKESIGDLVLASALFKDLKERYPDHDLYIGTLQEYFELVTPNPLVHKAIPYCTPMESELAMISSGEKKGLFDVYCNIAIMTQKVLNHLSLNQSLDLVKK